MSSLPLTAVSRTQGNNLAVKTGAITPHGYALEFEEVPILVDAFRRMVRRVEFDVCEMAITTYLCAKSHGKPFTALPIFLLRGLHHGAVVTSPAGTVKHPQDLHGRRVGVSRGYTVTTGVWARTILQQEHGVDLDSITWVRSGDEHVAEYQPPPNVASLEPGRTLRSALDDGDLAAVVGITTGDEPELTPLIEDPGAAALDALQSRGFYPINHLIVVRDEVLSAHPDLGAALFTAFAEAKSTYVAQLRADAIDTPSPTDRLNKRILDLTGTDPLPYGIEPNRAVLDVLMQQAVAQHILHEPLPLEAIFAAGTLDLTA
jgi:ABC-type nitrate/sulfonate/bicarbonate transport system substrate-binding protein